MSFQEDFLLITIVNVNFRMMNIFCELQASVYRGTVEIWSSFQTDPKTAIRTRQETSIRSVQIKINTDVIDYKGWYRLILHQ